MSRKGKMAIALPKGVEIKCAGQMVTVKGPKGTLSLQIAPSISLDVKADAVQVSTTDESRQGGANHGLYRTLVENMIIGTTKGFETRLEMIGVGYRAQLQGALLDVQVGFSHPTKLAIPTGLQVTVEKNTVIIISGIDKQAVGQFAAQVRATRPPEPYQGKGIRYAGEYVRKKAGKAAKTATK
jgi:large subunit ribosomal protein L6